MGNNATFPNQANYHGLRNGRFCCGQASFPRLHYLCIQFSLNPSRYEKTKDLKLGKDLKLQTITKRVLIRNVTLSSIICKKLNARVSQSVDATVVLGKMKPNLVLMGYKRDWNTSPEDELESFFGVTQ